jgi:FkbM family methyltransferase
MTMGRSRLAIYKLLNKLLSRAGYRIVSRRATPTCFARLEHMKQLGFEPRVVFDCGAFVGMWTRRASEIFPNATFVLIEPNKEIIGRAQTNIERISAKTILLDVAVGDSEGAAYLNIWETTKHRSRDLALAASSLLEHVQGEPTKRIPVQVQTLDSISSQSGLVPDLVKLDLQGGELAALRGAKSLFGKTELFIAEFGVLDAYTGRTTPRDLIDIMYDNNYCLYDIVDLGYRPYDKALVGGDFFFIDMKSRLREHKDFF